MPEFKERLIRELLDELYQNISSATYGPAGIIAVEPPALKHAIRKALLEKLNSDCVIIDKNKFKSKIMVIDYGPSDTLDNHNACLVSRFYFEQYVTPETLVNVDMDILKDRFKDNLIEILEECEF